MKLSGGIAQTHKFPKGDNYYAKTSQNTSAVNQGLTK